MAAGELTCNTWARNDVVAVFLRAAWRRGPSAIICYAAVTRHVLRVGRGSNMGYPAAG